MHGSLCPPPVWDHLLREEQEENWNLSHSAELGAAHLKEESQPSQAHMCRPQPGREHLPDHSCLLNHGWKEVLSPLRKGPFLP